MILFDGFTGYADKELDELVVKWRASGIKINEN